MKKELKEQRKKAREERDKNLVLRKIDEKIRWEAQEYLSNNDSPYTVEEFSALLRGYIRTCTLKEIFEEYEINIINKNRNASNE